MAPTAATLPGHGSGTTLDFNRNMNLHRGPGVPFGAIDGTGGRSIRRASPQGRRR